MPPLMIDSEIDLTLIFRNKINRHLMSISKIHLSVAALSHLSIESTECNFSFIIGSAIVKFPVYIAELLSPIISKNFLLILILIPF
jgi:hypothetical protein